MNSISRIMRNLATAFLFWKRLGKLTKYLALIFFVSFVVTWGGRPILTHVNMMRGKHALDIARASIEEGDWTQAAGSIQSAAHLLPPSDREFLRVLASYLEETQDNPAVLRDTLIRLKEAKADIPEDEIHFCRAMLQAGDFKTAINLYDLLPLEERESLQGVALMMEFKKAQGNLSNDGGTTPYQEALQNATTVFPELREIAVEKLWATSKGADKNALLAMNYLSQRESLTPQQATTLIQRMEAHPARSLPNVLGVFSGLLRIAPSKRTETMTYLVDRCRVYKEDEFKLFIQWLALEAEPDLIRHLVNDNQLFTDRSIFSSYAQAFGVSQRWQDLLNLLLSTEHVLPITPERSEIWQAEAWSHLQPNSSKTAVHLAAGVELSETSGNQAAITSAAKLAEEHGLWELAIHCYRVLAKQNPAKPLVFLERGLEVALRQSHSAGTYAITKQLLAERPNHPAYRLRYDYLRALLGVELETLDLNYEEGTHHDVRALIQALRAYRLGDTESMRRQLALVSAGATNLEIGQRAALAGLLAVSGQHSRSFQMAEFIAERALLEEERRLLRRAL